jgi:hypothetical protein
MLNLEVVPGDARAVYQKSGAFEPAELLIKLKNLFNPNPLSI